MPSFKAWACAAIDDVLVKHQGSMHWKDLQKAVVQRYFHDGPVSSGHSPRVRCLSHRVLAEIPSTHLDEHDALVRLRKRKRCDEKNHGDCSFTSWAKTAIHDTLTLHNGAMHWRGLQRALVRRYLETRPARKLKFEREVGKQVLARVPETYLSHDDSSVQLCGQMHVTPRSTTKRVRVPSSMSSGRGRRKLMRRLKVRLVAKGLPRISDCDLDKQLAVMPTPTQPIMDVGQPAVMCHPIGSPVIPQVRPAPQAAGGLENSRSALLLTPAQPVMHLEQPAALCQPLGPPGIPTIPAPLAARLQNVRSVLSKTAKSEMDMEQPAVTRPPFSSPVILPKSLPVASSAALRPAAIALAPPLGQQQSAAAPSISDSATKPPASPPMLPKFVNGRLQYAIPQSSSVTTPSLRSRAGGA